MFDQLAEGNLEFGVLGGNPDLCDLIDGTDYSCMTYQCGQHSLVVLFVSAQMMSPVGAYFNN